MQMEQLQKDMIAAMKARDKVRKDAISSLVSAAKKAAIDEGCRDNIPEELVNKVILKEMKSAEEVEKELTEQFSDVIATGNKGQIMKAVMPHFKGKADGKVINQVVAKLCAK